MFECDYVFIKINKIKKTGFQIDSINISDRNN